MKQGFNFKLYGTEFTNCFIHSSFYRNGNLQLSLFGVAPEFNEVTHFADITLEQNQIILKRNEIVVDCKFKYGFIRQLKELGILKEQTGICAVNNTIYPIYTINLDEVSQRQYCMQSISA